MNQKTIIRMLPFTSRKTYHIFPLDFSDFVSFPTFLYFLYNIGEVREFLDQEGMDVSGMSDEEIEDASEVFALSDGRYLIVEG